MKKVLYSLIAVSISFSAMAQNTKQADNSAMKHQRREYKADGDASQKLNLTTSQKQELKTINQDFKQQMQGLKGSAASTDLKTKREALIKDHQQRVDNILTPEQKIKAEELRKNHQGKSKRGMHGDGTVGKENHEKLNLTPEQQTKAKTLKEDYKSSVAQVEKNTALTEDQKTKELKTIKQKHREEMQSMLTTEQKENLKIRMRNRPKKTVK